MLFDRSKLKGKKEEKIAIGALKYIAIKEAFQMKSPLHENEIFRKYFTDFYVLRRGAFSTPIMQETFYRIFQSARELYDLKYNREDIYKNILTIISGIAGDNEPSFSSKILHTLDNGSPIIDSNVLTGLRVKKTPDSYNQLLFKYYGATEIEVSDEPGIKHVPRIGTDGLIRIADDDDWYNEFVRLCINWYTDIFISKNKNLKYDIKNIIRDICKVKYIKQSDPQIKKLEKEIEIEEALTAGGWENLSEKIKLFDVDIEKQISDISMVKKIDFYLWTRYAA